MIKLIRADLSRMFKTLSFWICCILMIGLMLLILLVDMSAANISMKAEVFASYISRSSIFVICFASIFISLFIGTDYTNGTIRNKISAGHGRCPVYLSNLVVGSIGGVIYCAVFWTVLTAVCFGSGWTLKMEFGELMYQLFICVSIVIATCSMLAVIGMIITSKASAITLTIVCVAGLLNIMSLLVDLLLRPKGDYMHIDGALRSVLTVVCNLLPFGQAIQLVTESVEGITYFPLYSAAFIVLMTGMGLAMFRVKDLK